MPKITKIAIVGLGAAALNIHLPAYKNMPDVEVVGAYDPADIKVKKQMTFPIYRDMESMLKTTRPDILTVSCPTPFHYESAYTGLEHGCHIFCEKPFTTNLCEAHTLIKKSRELKRWIVVNNQFRFMNMYETANDLIGTDDFGDLLFLSANQCFHVDKVTEAGWRGDDPQRTCKEFGIHVLDLCRFFFAEEPKSISAKMRRADGECGPDYLNLLQLEFSNNRWAQITLDRLTRGEHRYLDLRLDGTAATIDTQFGGRLEFSAGVRAKNKRPFMSLNFAPAGSADLCHGENRKRIATDPFNIFVNATQKLFTAMLAAIDNETVPQCEAGDNIKSLALMLAAYESDKSGTPIPFSDFRLKEI